MTRKPNYKPIICDRCGELTKRTAPHQKYCKPCSAIVEVEQQKQWRIDHPERWHEIVMKWRNNNMEQWLESKKQWELEHPHYSAQYQAVHPWYRKIAKHNRRARINGNGGTHTVEEEYELFSWQEGKCHYCGDFLYVNFPYHVEHKTPVARGGPNDISNIALACPDCNHHKNDKTEEEFIAWTNLNKVTKNATQK